MRTASSPEIRYASVWEDADILCEALAPVAPGGRLLSIASAGDNALALLTLDPVEVVAVDRNPAQLACLDLRRAAFRCLDHPRLLAFLGVTSARDRLAVYARLRRDLAPQSRAFWDAQPAAIARGVIHAGRFERYLRAFGRCVLPLIHSRRRIARLLEAKPRAAREQFYEREWDTWRWRALFGLFFSRAVMGRAGRDRALFAHATGRVAQQILARTRRALTALPTESNPYLGYIATGNYRPGALPRYLRREHAGVVRTRLDRLRLLEGSIEEVPDSGFDGFNLSDIFEGMSAEQHARAYAALLDRANPGARLVYWNLLVPRTRPDGEAHRAQPLALLAADLHARDRAWFYGGLNVDEVTNREATVTVAGSRCDPATLPLPTPTR